MTSLSIAALIVGGLIVVLNLPALLAPGKTLAALQAFPRNRNAAWVLTGIDLAWVAWLVYHASLGRFDALKPFLWIAAPLAFAAIVVFMDELLAPRALGGLLLLAASPILNAARWHPSSWRLVMTVLAYVWVIAGILLVLGPYRLRLWSRWLTGHEGRCRALGAVRVVIGLGIVVLALTVYRG